MIEFTNLKSEKFNIAKKILIILLPFLFLSNLLFNWKYEIDKETLTEKWISTIKEQVSMIDFVIENSFNNIYNDINLIIESDEFTRFVEEENISSKNELKEMFARFIKSKPSFEKILLIDKSGFETIRVNNEASLVNINKNNFQDKIVQEYLEEPINLEKNTVYISNFDVYTEKEDNNESNKSTLRISRPIYKKDEKIGTLVVSCNGNDILSIFSKKIELKNNKIKTGIIGFDGSWIFRDGKTYNQDDPLFNTYSTLKIENPVLQQNLQKSKENILFVDKEVYYYKNVSPLKNFNAVYNLNSPYYWTILSSFNENKILDESSNLLLRNKNIKWLLFIFISAITSVLTIVSYVFYNEKMLLHVSSLISEYTHDGVIITDRDKKILYCNKAFELITGYSQQDLIGKTPKILSVPEHKNIIKKDPGDNTKCGGTVWDISKNNSYFQINLLLKKIKSEKNKTTYFIGIYSEIKRNFFNPEDLLLPNLSKNEYHSDPIINSIVKKKTETKKDFYLVFIKISNYENIRVFFNDGDEYRFASEVVNHLKYAVAKEDLIAQYSSDVFMITLSQISKTDFKIKMKEIRSIMNRPVQIAGEDIHIELISGVSFYPESGESADQLVNNAKIALMTLIHLEKRDYLIYNHDLYSILKREIDIINALPNALRNKEFTVYYQPQVNIKNNKIIGAEALIRWNSPSLGNVSPGEFIPIIEKNELIKELGRFVVSEVVTLLKNLVIEDMTAFQIAVNLSALELNESDIVDEIMDILTKNKINTDRISIEITEGSLLTDLEKINSKLLEFQKKNISIAIDDFGTGFSSLSYLRNLNINKLKVDKAFIRDFPENDEGLIAKAIISMGHDLKMKVIAEGVENNKQLDFLKSLGCDEYQGYLFSKPVNRELFINILKKNKIINHSVLA